MQENGKKLTQSQAWIIITSEYITLKESQILKFDSVLGMTWAPLNSLVIFLSMLLLAMFMAFALESGATEPDCSSIQATGVFCVEVPVLS